MVFPTEIDSVDIHASVVGPIIRECDDQFDAGLACSIDDFIESLDVDCRLAVRPALEDDFSASSTFTAVLWKTFRDVTFLSLNPHVRKTFRPAFFAAVMPSSTSD
jgi:hypothetical protein